MTVAVESVPGNGIYIDLSAYLEFTLSSIKFNSCDLIFVNPPAGNLQLTAGVRLVNPTWIGNVASVIVADRDVRSTNQLVTVTATNTSVLIAGTSPFDLADEDTSSGTLFELEDGSGHVLEEDGTGILLSGVTLDAVTNYELEDGSGHIMLEDGTDWSPGIILTEGSLSQPHQIGSLSVRKAVAPVSGGAPVTYGHVRIFAPGMQVGQVFNLTDLGQGYVLAPFEVTQVTTMWAGLSKNPSFDIEFGDTPATLAAWATTIAPVPVTPIVPPVVIPSGPVIYGNTSSGHVTYAMGGGNVTICQATFTVSVPLLHTLTVQVVGAIDARMIAWDNYVTAPRRGVRAVLSGGIYTGAWQELPFGLARATYDLSSSAGIALAAGTYTVSITINTVEYNQMEVFSAWVQAAVTTV